MKQELQKLFQASLKEMEKHKVVLLTREDLIRREDSFKYKEMYRQLKNLSNGLKKGEDAKRILNEKNEIFRKHESFFMDIFDTRQFNMLFELFEYEN